MPGNSGQIDSGKFLLPWSKNSVRSKRRGSCWESSEQRGGLSREDQRQRKQLLRVQLSGQSRETIQRREEAWKEEEEAGNIWIKAYLGALETGDGSAVAWWKRTPSKLRT